MPLQKKSLVTYSLCVLLVFIAWRVFSLGVADHYAKSNPARALFWRNNHPEALFRMAEQQAAQKKWTDAQRFAKRAILANPLDGRALRVLAQAADANGNAKGAVILYQKASILAPRDVFTHAWLLDYALKNEQAGLAVQHLDALLRLQPELLTTLQAQANLLAVNPLTQPYMVKALSHSPPWRLSFLKAFSNAQLPLDAMSLLFHGVGQHSSLELSEYQPWLKRLINEQRYLQAYVSWAGLIPMAQRSYLGNVFDGGFEIPQDEQLGQFAWSTKPIKGASMYWASDAGQSGANAFFVEFEGIRTKFANLQQLLALPAGKWRLNFKAKANRLDSSRGLVWQIRCLNDNQPLAESEPMRGMFNWKPMQLDFVVPEQCAGQSLTLMIPARIQAETLVRGQLWLDDVSIEMQSENRL